MKLYFFQCGILKTYKHLITMNVDIGKPFDIPVPFFLIQHPKGNVLFDTGNGKEVAIDAKSHWGGVLNAYDPVMKKEDFVVEQLLKCGIKPSEIDYVILSHLHLDHAGGVGAFPNAQYIVQRKELEYAYVPDYFQKSAYIRKDFDKEVNWFFLNGDKDDQYDLFGDSSLIIWFTPGHTPGHQSLQVNLKNSGSFLLTGDACYTEEILNTNILPGLMSNAEQVVNSLNKMRQAKKTQNVHIVCGHDPMAWTNYKKAPEYYE